MGIHPQVRVVVAARGLLSAAYELGAGQTWNHIGGWLALGIFCIAMYGGIAFLLEDALGHTVLLLARRGGSREAVGGVSATSCAVSRTRRVCGTPSKGRPQS
jgi:hypothetical protein